MMKTIGIIILFWFYNPIFGQNEVEVSFITIANYLFPEEAELHYLLANDVAFRKEPSSTSKLIQTLSIGTSFIIHEKSDSAEVKKGIKSHWYKIEIKNQFGWIWGGLIARNAFGSHSDPTVKFVSGYEKVISNQSDDIDGVYYQVRAIKNHKQLSKIVVKSFARDIGFSSNSGNNGLDNVDDILVLEVPCYGGCGCSTGEIYIFWNEGHFYEAAVTMGSPDAEYSEGEYLIFPSNIEGIKGQIIKYRSGVGEEKEGELERLITQTYYYWDGKKLKRTSKKPKIKRYYIPVD